jgi:cytochrome c biogenesis protein
MCITTVVSYLSHSQVWAAQSGGSVLVGGATNRAKFSFEQELGEVLGQVPEVPAAAPGLVDAAAAGGGSGRSGPAA